MNKIKGIFFDLDGVLIDTQKTHYLSLNKALNDHGYNLTEAQENTVYKGLPTREKLKQLSIIQYIPVSIQESIYEAKKRYFNDFRDQIPADRDLLQDVFQELKAANFKIAVCSNSIRESVDYFIRKLELTHLVDLSLSNEDVHLAKPDPEIYIKAQQFFNLSPDQCLIIEDSPFGIRAAVQSRSFVMEVSGTHEVTLQSIFDHLKLIETKLGSK